MKQVLVRQGQVEVATVPAPQVEAGTVLVQVDHSCISIGTEMSGLKAATVPLWKRALREPHNVKKAIQMVATQGLRRTKSQITGQLTAGNPTGYSAAGTVIAVGEGIHDLKPGDRVACAGAQCAHHAEVIRVPRNLCVPVPDGVDFAEASTVTLGAIALQGVRRANPTLGETFVVIGLGILGQLTAQMLKANGCRVIGMDLDDERMTLAESLGMDRGLRPDDGPAADHVARLTDGYGADGVIITAATPSHEVVSTAFNLTRRKGRVVLVGDVGLNLKRADFYQKELDFFISTSYGPGRYDGRYEEEGLDYPIGYVRWTENRNMAEYLRLIADGKVQLKKLIAAAYPIDQAPEAYAALKSGEKKPLMVLLHYPQRQDAIQRTVPNPHAAAGGTGKLRVALAGAGGFAKGMHLPNMREMNDRFHLQAVMSRTGHNAVATARQFAANYSTTDYDQILNDKDVDLVLIATRHHLHASMALAALRAGKHVLLEKPMAMTRAEMAEIEAFYAEQPAGATPPVLLTGFNRRFSPFATRLQELVSSRSNPMILNYRMNAGYLPLDHWTQTGEGGGRNIGEACHIYDLFTYLTGSRVIDVQAHAIAPTSGHYSSRDNFVATMTFADGSVATLTYTALGSKDYPKEQLEVYVDGKVYVLQDYKDLLIHGSPAKGVKTQVHEKGQKEELAALAACLRTGGDWPIPLWQQVQATEISFRVEDQLGPLPALTHDETANEPVEVN